MDGMKPSLAAAVTIALVTLAGCGGSDDPDRFDALYDESMRAIENVDAEADPDDADDLEAAFGWGKDSDYKVAEYKPGSDDAGTVACFVNREQDTYLYLSGETGGLYMGDGECSDDERQAKVVLDGETGMVTKGEDFVPSAVEDATEDAEAGVISDAKNVAIEMETWLTDNVTSDPMLRADEGFEDVLNGTEVRNFASDDWNYSFCVVDTATEAWAVYDSQNGGLGATGAEGADCVGS